MSDGFVNLHLHTDKSLLDGMIKVDALFKKTLDFNQKAVAITDHGNMYQVVDATLEAKKTGQKYIIGTELYVVNDHTIKGKSEGESEYSNNRKHFLMLAKNKTGYQKMCRIVSKGYTDGFYYRPRVDNGIFEKFLDDKEDDLITSSACFVKGTKVFTYDGIKNIEDIQKGDTVLTHKGIYKEVETPTQRKYKGNVCIIKSTMSVIECTEDHKFLTVSERELFDVTNGVNRFYTEHNTAKNPLRDVRNYSVKANGKWKKAKHLKKTDFLLTPIDEYVQNITEIELKLYEYTPNGYIEKHQKLQVTDDLLYFLGLVYSCGKFTTKEKPYGLTMYVNLYKDKDFICNFIKNTFGVSPEVNELEDTFRVHSSCAKLNSLFGSFGNGIPEFIKHMPFDKQMIFFKGFFASSESSGFNSFKKSVCFTTDNEYIFYDVQRILHRNYINFEAKAYETFFGNMTYVLCVLDTSDMLLNYIVYDKELKTVYNNMPIKHIPIEIDGVLYMKHRIFAVYTKEVETTVYCMNVKDDHSFIANGVAVHNCLAGEIPQYIMQGNVEKARDVAKYYEKLFHGNFYLEIQPMESYEQYIVNKELIAMSKELSIPMIATTDAHYLNYEDKETHDVLLCLQSSSLVSDPNRWKFPGNSYYVMSKDEIIDYFTRSYSYKLIKKKNMKKNAITEFRYEYVHDYDGIKFTNPEKTITDFVSIEAEGSFSYADLDQNAIANAIAETETVADKCNYNIELGNHYLPKINIPVENENFKKWREKLKNKQKDNEDYLKYLCIKGLIKLGLTDKVYRERLQYELGIINSMEFPDYFLIYEDIANFCHKENIPLGPGRGCFMQDSVVTTENEKKPIQAVSIGDEVYCHDELLHKVVATHEYDIEEEIVSFEVGDKKIKGTTLDHEIYAIKKKDYDLGIREPKWYHAKDLAEGDFICEL